MADQRADTAHVGGAVAAYLLFALSAAFAVRPDGSTRWSALLVALIAIVAAAWSLVTAARMGRRSSGGDHRDIG